MSENPPLEFLPHTSDPKAVKEAKTIANCILQNKRTFKRSWRIDYSVFFERYVQYLFGEISKSTGWKAVCNPQYPISGKRPTWGLHYLEPDLVLQKDETQYVLDAKYKSHMYNWSDAGSDNLKDTFRHDLHQILAYCSFNQMTTKKAFLVYPFADFSCHRLHLGSPLSRSEADVCLVGVPLSKNKLAEVKMELSQLISRL